MITAAVTGIGPAHVVLAAELTVKAAVLAGVLFLIWDARASFVALGRRIAALLIVDITSAAAYVHAVFQAPAGRHRARRFAAPPAATTAPPFADAPTLVLPPLETQP